MNSRNSSALFSRVIPISALLLVLLFKFQNCAPAPQMATLPGGGGADGQVRIVDRWAEQKVSFLNSSETLPGAQDSFALQGLCVGSQKGQLIEYQVLSLATMPVLISSGVVECVMGGFEVLIEGISFSTCSDQLQVRAIRQGDNSSFAETVLRPECSSSQI